MNFTLPHTPCCLAVDLVVYNIAIRLHSIIIRNTRKLVETKEGPVENVCDVEEDA
jgi:hypothetical protein